MEYLLLWLILTEDPPRHETECPEPAEEVQPSEEPEFIPEIVEELGTCGGGRNPHPCIRTYETTENGGTRYLRSRTLSWDKSKSNDQKITSP